MRARISWLLSVPLLLGATAATAQSFPCTSVAPEVRDSVREAGACRDVPPSTGAPNAVTSPASSTVTMKLSDGTVVRVPREISTSLGEGRKPAAPGRTTAKANESAPQKLAVPDVKQETAPGTTVLPGSNAKPQVSDGPISAAAGTNPVTAPTTTAAAASAPVSVGASSSVSEPAAPPGLSSRFGLSTNAALILGAGVLLSLLFGALLMRRRLALRRRLVLGERATPSWLLETESPPPQAVAIATDDVSEAAAAPEITFAARVEPGETTIRFAPRSEGDQVATERSSDHHA